MERQIFLIKQTISQVVTNIILVLSQQF